MPDPPSQSEHDNRDKREQPNLEQILPKLQNLEDTIDQTISKKLAESYKCMEENIYQCKRILRWTYEKFNSIYPRKSMSKL